MYGSKQKTIYVTSIYKKVIEKSVVAMKLVSLNE